MSQSGIPSASGQIARAPLITDARWRTLRVLIPVDQISYIAGILEAYDNHFLVRTESQGQGIMRIWFPQENRLLLNDVLLEFRSEFTVEILEESEGMAGLDEVYPD
jgi:hypothetical protein